MKRWHWLIGIVFVLLVFSGCSAEVRHTVRAGETLRSIASEYKSTVPDIVDANRAQYPDLAANQTVRPGMVLEVPVGSGLNQAVAGLVEEVVQKVESRIGTSDPAPVAEASSPTDNKVLTTDDLINQMINDARVPNSLKGLIIDPTLTKIAQARSDDMIARGYFSHTDPTTGKFAFEELIRSNHFSYMYAGENIAEIRNEGSFVPPALTVYARYGARELAQQFVTGWLNSPEHRDNIMNSRFRLTGIAVSVSSDKTRVVATQVFAD